MNQTLNRGISLILSMKMKIVRGKKEYTRMNINIIIIH